ncbi:siroheme synthase [Kitasatospora sp. MAP12-44]|nr:siroheme synthase [Kitasatospora sp. MAP12-44]
MSPTATADRSGRCTFLGAGPGDPGLLTLRAVEVLASADILIADPLTAAAVRTHCPEGVQVRTTAATDADAAATDIGGWGDAASLAKLVADAVTAGKHVVRTVDGDPGLDGRAAEEMLLCAKAGLAFEVIPGVAQSVGVPAYAGVPLRGSNGADVRFVDGAALVAGALVDLGAPETTLVVRTTLGQLPATAAALVTHGRKPDAALCATLSGTTTRQRTFTATLATIAAELKVARVLPSPVSAPVDPATSVIAVVGEQVAHRSSHSWFETKPLFGWNVLVPRTKEQATRPLRAAALLRRGTAGGADHRGRAAAHPAADGAGDQGPGHRPL